MIDLDQIAAERAPEVARKLIWAANQPGREADFRRDVEHVLEDLSELVGMSLAPRDEFSVARGRVDSLYVTEATAPSRWVSMGGCRRGRVW